MFFDFSQEDLAAAKHGETAALMKLEKFRKLASSERLRYRILLEGLPAGKEGVDGCGGRGAIRSGNGKGCKFQRQGGARESRDAESNIDRGGEWSRAAGGAGAQGRVGQTVRPEVRWRQGSGRDWWSFEKKRG